MRQRQLDMRLILVALMATIALFGAGAATAPAPSACPMAHCDPRLSDDEPGAFPTNGVAITWAFDRTGVINRIGLGCSVAGKLAVCTGTSPGDPSRYDQPYVTGVDALTGRVLWNSGT